VHQGTLAVELILQLGPVQSDQNLPFLDRVAHVHQHSLDSAFNLRAHRALIERVERAHGLHAPPHHLLFHRKSAHHNGVASIAADARGLRARTTSLQNDQGQQRGAGEQPFHGSSREVR